MTTEDFEPKGETEGGHPEVRENIEATLPASAASKEQLVAAISAELGDNPKPERSSWGKAMRDPDTMRPVDLARYTKGSRRDNVTAKISIIDLREKPTDPRIIWHYKFMDTPDGLQAETSHFIDSDLPPESFATTEEAIAEAHRRALLMEKLKQGAQRERELGLSFFSEAKAKELKSLLERLEPF